MSKNNSVATSIVNTDSIMLDESFKDLARYKCVAAILIKFTIPEFKDMDYIDIAKHIKDSKKRVYESDADLIQSEIDLAPSEAGTANEKNTINDVVFYMETPKGELIETSINSALKLDDEKPKSVLKPELTVDLEMQTTNYSRIIPRGIYYGASLLRDTVAKGDRTYANIHKVYSIWFCNFKFSENTMIRSDKIKDDFIHRYRICRDYPNSEEKRVFNDSIADLINVTFVELPRLFEQVERDNGTEIRDLVAKLFYDTRNSVSMIEKVQKVNLTKYRKVVANRMDWNAKAKEERAEGKVEGRLEMLVSFVESLKQTGPDACRKAARKHLNPTDAEIEEAIDIVFGNKN